MKHILFVYNPVAGVGKVRKNLFEIVDFYDANNCMVTLCPIRRLDDYYDLLQLEEKRYDMVVCSGGDGTLNILISFLMNKGIAMKTAYIPAGSTNDYAYSLGIEDDLQQALKRTLEGKEKNIDIGKFNDKYFLYVAAFGIFTKVAYSTSQKAKNLLGHTAYILEGIKQLSELKSYQLCINADNEIIEGEFILGLITNTLSVGGFRNIMPNDVAMDDGKHEVIFIRKPNSIIELNNIIRSLLGEKLDSNPNILYRKTENIVITSKEEVSWTLDGEYGGDYAEVTATNLRQRFTIIV